MSEKEDTYLKCPAARLGGRGRRKEEGEQSLLLRSKSGFYSLPPLLLRNEKGELEGGRRTREGETKLLLIHCPVFNAVSSHQEHHPKRHKVAALKSK